MAEDPASLPASLSLPPQDHLPAISSPLNPDVAASKPRPFKPPPREREPREKKETLKKREASGNVQNQTSTVPSKRKASGVAVSAPSPMRYSIPEPRLSDYDAPREPNFVSHEPLPLITPDGEIELKRPSDQ